MTTTTDKLAAALRRALTHTETIANDSSLGTAAAAADVETARAALASYDALRALDDAWKLWEVRGTFRGQLQRGIDVRAADGETAIEKARDYFARERLPRGTKWTATERPA